MMVESRSSYRFAALRIFLYKDRLSCFVRNAWKNSEIEKEKTRKMCLIRSEKNKLSEHSKIKEKLCKILTIHKTFFRKFSEDCR